MFDHCMYFNTAALARRLEQEWTLAFKAFDLTPPQAFLLRAVVAKPGQVQSELADALAISRPTATRALDGLAAKQLVVRQACKEDGRQVAIYPTPRAVELGPALNEAGAKATVRLKKRLGPQVFEELVQRVKSVRSALE